MRFKFTIGGYFSDANFEIIYRTGALHCSKSEMPGLQPETVKVVPVKENKDWEAMLLFLADCKWENQYSSDSLDGTQWRLSAFNRPYFQHNVYGSNAYPKDFRKFLRLLNSLIGGEDFKISL